MRAVILLPILLGLLLVGCQPADHTTQPVGHVTRSPSSADKEPIQVLLRQALHWANSPQGIGVLPVVMDRKDSVYVGVDRAQLTQNLAKLKATTFFSPGFINNYNQLVLAIDAGLRRGTYEPWLVGDGPTIVFVSEVNPWCLCQDVPYDHPNPWDNIEVSLVNQDHATVEAVWRWGNLRLLLDPAELKANPDLLATDPTVKEWQAFSYKMRVTKEAGKWQIAYLQGFDFAEGIRQYR